MEQSKLNEILKLHKMWLNDESDGKKANLCGANLHRANLCGANLHRADLRGANLCGADLHRANLRGADLRGADLHRANLRGADLRGANLHRANLCGVDLHRADLHRANLRGADLCEADLCEADLCEADLCEANLREANLRGADLRGAEIENVNYSHKTSFFALHCPEEGSFVAYKKAGGEIVKLLVTEDAKRSSATTRKCRCSRAKVLEIDGGLQKIASNYDDDFIYKVGEIVEVADFDEDRWNECSTGIHFFITRREAELY